MTRLVLLLFDQPSDRALAIIAVAGGVTGLLLALLLHSNGILQMDPNAGIAGVVVGGIAFGAIVTPFAWMLVTCSFVAKMGRDWAKKQTVRNELLLAGRNADLTEFDQTLKTSAELRTLEERWRNAGHSVPPGFTALIAELKRQHH